MAGKIIRLETTIKRQEWELANAKEELQQTRDELAGVREEVADSIDDKELLETRVSELVAEVADLEQAILGVSAPPAFFIFFRY